MKKMKMMNMLLVVSYPPANIQNPHTHKYKKELHQNLENLEGQYSNSKENKLRG